MPMFFILIVFQATEPLGNIKFMRRCPILGSNLVSLQEEISHVSASLMNTFPGIVKLLM